MSRMPLMSSQNFLKCRLKILLTFRPELHTRIRQRRLHSARPFEQVANVFTRLLAVAFQIFRPSHRLEKTRLFRSVGCLGLLAIGRDKARVTKEQGLEAESGLEVTIFLPRAVVVVF